MVSVKNHVRCFEVLPQDYSLGHFLHHTRHLHAERKQRQPMQQVCTLTSKLKQDNRHARIPITTTLH